MIKLRLAVLFSLILLAAASAMAAPHSVVLNWTASTDIGIAYNMYRLNGSCPTGAPSGFTKINTASITGTTFTDSGMAPGSYCYYMTATLNGAESVPSNTAAAVILPAAPTGLQATVTN